MAKIVIINRIKTLLYVALVTLVFLSSCSDDEDSNIPLVPVNIQLNINDPAYLNLQTIGGSVEIFGGSRGIILYRLSNEEIKAYDRHCTFQPSNSCALVNVDASRFTASDQCCGSTFLLIDGSVSQPPATFPLKSYPTFFDGTFLSITN